MTNIALAWTDPFINENQVCHEGESITVFLVSDALILIHTSIYFRKKRNKILNEQRSTISLLCFLRSCTCSKNAGLNVHHFDKHSQLRIMILFLSFLVFALSNGCRRVSDSAGFESLELMAELQVDHEERMEDWLRSVKRIGIMGSLEDQTRGSCNAAAHIFQKRFDFQVVEEAIAKEWKTLDASCELRNKMASRPIEGVCDSEKFYIDLWWKYVNTLLPCK